MEEKDFLHNPGNGDLCGSPPQYCRLKNSKKGLYRCGNGANLRKIKNLPKIVCSATKGIPVYPPQYFCLLGWLHPSFYMGVPIWQMVAPILLHGLTHPATRLHPSHYMGLPILLHGCTHLPDGCTHPLRWMYPSNYMVIPILLHGCTHLCTRSYPLFSILKKNACHDNLYHHKQINYANYSCIVILS